MAAHATHSAAVTLLETIHTSQVHSSSRWGNISDRLGSFPSDAASACTVYTATLVHTLCIKYDKDNTHNHARFLSEALVNSHQNVSLVRTVHWNTVCKCQRGISLAVTWRLCVCYKSAFYQKGQMDPDAGFWYEGFLQTILYCSIRKFGYFQNKQTSSGDLSQTLELENFTMACPSSQRIVNLVWQRWTLHLQ